MSYKHTKIITKMPHRLIRFLSLFLCFLLIFEQTGLTQVLPSALNPALSTLPLLRYLSVNPANPFNYFNFLLDKGDTSEVAEGLLGGRSGSDLNSQAKKLINYFFLGITLPSSSFWVNLRPDTPDKITSTELSKTDLGRVLLEQDLRLKKDVSRYLHPNHPQGKEYWERLYSTIGKDKAKKAKITTQNRVWIVPEEATVLETEDGALVVSAKLKVLLETEYLELQNKRGVAVKDEESILNISEQLMKEIILPALTQDINTSPHYAPLRQIYHSLILAEWFKRKIKDGSRLAVSGLRETPTTENRTPNTEIQSPYALAIDKGYLKGLESETPWEKDSFYQQYLKSYSEGEYKLEASLFGLRRMYWSGGVTFAGLSGEGAGGSAGSPLTVITPEELKNKPGLLNQKKLNFGQMLLRIETDAFIENNAVAQPKNIEIIPIGKEEKPKEAPSPDMAYQSKANLKKPGASEKKSASSAMQVEGKGSDTFSMEEVKNFKRQPIPNTPEEFKSWLRNLSPADLVFVHISDKSPDRESDGSLVQRTRYGYYEKYNQSLKELATLRDTLHFTVNGVVVPRHGFTGGGLLGAGWERRNFALIIPFEKIDRDKMLNFSPEDTYFLGDVKIPQGSTIIVDIFGVDELVKNGTISEQQLAPIMDAFSYSNPSTSQIILEFQHNGIDYQIIDSRNIDFREAIYQKLERLGYPAIEMGDYGWIEGVPYEDFWSKYNLPHSGLHQEHWTKDLERNFNTVKYFDSLLPTINSGKITSFDDLEKLGKECDKIDKDLYRFVASAGYTTPWNNIAVPSEYKKVLLELAIEKIREVNSKLETIQSSLTDAQKDYLEKLYIKNLYPLPDKVISWGKKLLDSLNKEFARLNSSLIVGGDEATKPASNAGLEEATRPGGIDLSQIELTLKDEKFISSLNPAERKVLLAAKYLKDGWNSLSLLYVPEIMLLLKDNLIKDVQNRDLLFGILQQLKTKDFLDPQALQFLQLIQSQKPLSEIKVTLYR